MPGAAADNPPSKRYQYASPTASLSVWLDEGNDFVDASLSSGLQQISAQIVADLASR